MKYIKRYNEELKSTIYDDAAKKLKELGHNRRSSSMQDWAKETKLKETEIDNKKYGSFLLDIVGRRWDSKNNNSISKVDILKGGRFYIKPYFIRDWTRDNFCDYSNEDPPFKSGGQLIFEFGIIPADSNTAKMLVDSKDRLTNETYDGIYLCNRLYYNIVKKNGRTIDPDGSYIWDFMESDGFYFSNRQEAIRFKKLFVDSLNGLNKWGDEGRLGSMYDDISRFFNDESLRHHLANRGLTDMLNFGDKKKVGESAKRMSLNQLYVSE